MGEQNTPFKTMKATQLSALASLAITTGLTSCIWDSSPVPEIPYRPRPVVIRTPQPTDAPQETTTWESAPEASNYITGYMQEATNAPLPPTPAEPLPAPTPEPPQPAPEPPAPAITPIDLTTPTAPAPATQPIAPPPAAQPTDPKQITNVGPIPTASPVEGDPTRVWNPLDPSKKIRIINPKTNQPYPSGKKLKVRGTNFQFYVP